MEYGLLGRRGTHKSDRSTHRQDVTLREQSTSGTGSPEFETCYTLLPVKSFPDARNSQLKNTGCWLFGRDSFRVGRRASRSGVVRVTFGIRRFPSEVFGRQFDQKAARLRGPFAFDYLYLMNGHMCRNMFSFFPKTDRPTESSHPRYCLVDLVAEETQERNLATRDKFDLRLP